MIILTNILGFVEQINRRREHRKPSELDTLECIFIGPVAQASNVCPSYLAIHPQFPGMCNVGWSIVDNEATLATVNASYIGKLDATTSTIGTPLVSWSVNEGSVSWTSYAGTIRKVLQPAWTQTGTYNNLGDPREGTISTPATYSTAYLSLVYVSRFTTTSYTKRYLSKSPPTTGGIDSRAKITKQVTYVTGASKANDLFGLVTAELVLTRECDVTVEDQGNGWFDVSEVTSMKPYINSSANITL